METEIFKIGKFNIEIVKGYGVTKFVDTEGVDLTYLFSNIWTDKKYHNYINHIFDNKEYIDGLNEMLNTLFIIALEMKKQDKGESYAHFCTHIFNCIVNYSHYLCQFH